MPLSILLAVVAIVVALAVTATRGTARSGSRFASGAVGVWIGLLILALAVWTIGTLIFGR